MGTFPELTAIECCLYLMARDNRERLEYFLSYYLQKITLINHFYPIIPVELKGYSDHGHKHVQNIIQLQQKILVSNVPHLQKLINEDDDEIPEDSAFNFYELYLLLSATLWHDIGNIIARTRHNENITPIEQKIQHYFVNTEIKTHVLQIAKAHTGSDGVKTQIPLTVSSYCNEQISCQFIGALLRFTDELDEGQNRLDISYYERFEDRIGEHQKIFWETCKCIKRIHPDPEHFEIIIDVNIEKQEIWKKYVKVINEGKPDEVEKEICILDELIFRINKINIERMNYMEFVQKFLDFKRIKLTLNILDGVNTQSVQKCFSDQFGYKEFWEACPDLNPERQLTGYKLQLRY